MLRVIAFSETYGNAEAQNRPQVVTDIIHERCSGGLNSAPARLQGVKFRYDKRKIMNNGLQGPLVKCLRRYLTITTSPSSKFKCEKLLSAEIIRPMG